MEPKPKQTGGLALLMQESAGHIRPKMKASLAPSDSLLCHVGYNLPVTGIKYQRIVRIISICSHFLPTPRKDMWEAKLHGGLKINPKLAITVNFQACVELSGFHLRPVSLCGSCGFTCVRPAVTGKTGKFGADSRRSRLIPGDNPPLLADNHKGLFLGVCFDDCLVDSVNSRLLTKDLKTF